MKDFVELISTFFGEYFAYTVNALTVKEIWFEPTEIDRENQKKSLTLNPKQVIFTIFNILIGTCVISIVTKIDFTGITPFIVTAILMWFLWSFFGYLICKALRLNELTFLKSLALTMQTFGVVYLLASILTFITFTAYKSLDVNVLDIFLIFQFPLLVIYLSIAYFKNYTFRFKLQPIFAALICSLIYAIMNITISDITEEKELPAMVGKPPESVVIVDASIIQKGQTGSDILASVDGVDINEILVASDSIFNISTGNTQPDIDSLFEKVKYNKKPNFNDLSASLNEYSPVSNLHIISNFKWLSSDSSSFVFCDTLVAHYELPDTTDKVKLLKLSNQLDSTFKSRHYTYNKLILVPQLLVKKNKKFRD